MLKNLLLFVFIGLTAFSMAPQASADRRSYVWTYEYMTMRKGAREVEYYLTTEIPDADKSNINTLKHWLELEYGLTDRWDVAVYQMWKTRSKRQETDSEYDGFKLRTRYRFAEKNELPLDTLVYLEYIREADLHKPHIIEAKLILAKDIGRCNISYNQVFKRNLESEGKSGHEYAAGINYKVMDRVRLGIESKGNYSREKYALGPTLALSWGRKFWMSMGAVFGVNERTDDVQTRMIVGIPF